MMDWDDIYTYIGIFFMVAILCMVTLFVSNQYIKWEKVPVIEQNINSTAYTCAPDIGYSWDFSIYWDKWYIYLIVLIIFASALFFVWTIISFFGNFN